MEQDTTFAQDDAELEGYDPFSAAAAAEDAADDESPDDDVAPDDPDQDDDADPAAEAPFEGLRPVEEDPATALADARRQLAERDKADRERADADAQREAERQREAIAQAEQQRQSNRRTAQQVYAGKKARLTQARVQDAVSAAKADDPALMAQHLATLRAREEQAIDAEYGAWTETDRQLEVQELRRQRDRAALGQYAEHVRDAYGLPHDELPNITHYRDGTAVDPYAMSARAAEIVALRKERANHKRQLTRQAREDGRGDLRGRTAATPGRGRGTPGQEIEGTLEELHTLFPWRR